MPQHFTIEFLWVLKYLISISALSSSFWWLDVRSESETSHSETDQDEEQDSYSDDFEDEEKSTSAADATNSHSYVSLVHAEHAEK